VFSAPEIYLSQRRALGFDRVNYGVGGIELFNPDSIAECQLGYAVAPDGKSLRSDAPGGWHSDWLVIGHETSCGDPIFMSQQAPHPVNTAMHGMGTWEAMPVAPTLESFWKCLALFKHFSRGRENPVDRDTNPPDDEEIERYLTEILDLCHGDEEAAAFWSVQAEIGMSESSDAEP